MKYREALELRNEDEVMTKKDGKILTVVEVKVDYLHKQVAVFCADGNYYIHTELY